ncbi:MAG: hypothetical protein GKR87_13890 [Kiritimatiellae bacterium]|nr:hypothetical protein [Kiritimatiellia bacterium]
MKQPKDNITGVVIHSAQIEWSTLRKRKGQLNVVTQHTKPLETDAAEDVESSAIAKKLKSIFGKLKSGICLGLNTDKTLIRIVNFPTTDADELASMVELQVDKFFPFPVEQMIVSYEVLTQDETSSHILITAAHRRDIEALSDPFIEAGVPLTHIDIQVLGWFELLKEAGEIVSEGTHVYMFLDKTGAQLVATHNGKPLVFRTLAEHLDVLPDEYIHDMVEETNYTLTSLESEWGGVYASQITLWHSEDVLTELANALHKKCNLPVTTRCFEELPLLSEGLARRAVRNDQEIINLALPEWGLQEKKRKAKRRFISTAAALIFLWFLIIATLVVSSHVTSTQLDVLTSEVEDLEKPIEKMRTKVEELEQYADRSRTGLEALREITVLLPKGVDLTSFSYKKRKNVTVSGQSKSVNPIYDFFEVVGQSPLFETIKPGKIERRRNMSLFNKLVATFPETGTP